MGLFNIQRNRLLKQIDEAKKKKLVFEAKARKEEIILNKRIIQKEELDQLKFNLSRLKHKPKNKAELVARNKKIVKVKQIAKRLAGSLGRGIIIFIEAFVQDLSEEDETPKRKSKKVKKRK